MKKKIFLFLISLVIFSGTTIASPQDSISTSYKKGEFVTYCQVWVNASDSISSAVAMDFNSQIESNFKSLFGWAFKRLRMQGEKGGLILFKYKSSSFNKDTRTIRGVTDVIVPSIMTVPNVIIESKITKQKKPDGREMFYINLVYSNTFLKTMNGKFQIRAVKNKGCWFTLETRSSFGWFFDLFITQSKYKEIAEWRLRRFVLNLKEEAERRAKQD